MGADSTTAMSPRCGTFFFSGFSASTRRLTNPRLMTPPSLKHCPATTLIVTFAALFAVPTDPRETSLTSGLLSYTP